MEKLKCKMVMLSTKGGSLLTRRMKTNELLYSYKEFANHTGGEGEPININQHLYFVSDREIKKGDYVMLPDGRGIKLMSNSDVLDYLNSESFATKKIEATTDPTLGLPLIPQSFVQKYVEKQGGIEYVMINLIDNGCEEWMGDDYNGEPFWNERIEIETRKDNTVICSQVKDTWNKEELINMIELYVSSNTYFKVKNKMGLPEYIKEWVEDNYL